MIGKALSIIRHKRYLIKHICFKLHSWISRFYTHIITTIKFIQINIKFVNLSYLLDALCGS